MQNKSFKTLVATLTAIVTVLGATVACLGTVASSGAADADFRGVSAAIKGQKEGVINHILAYEHLRAYTSYIRYDEMGNLLYDEAVGSETENEDLTNRRMEAWGLADSIKISFFPPRYVDVFTGEYDIQRELGELWVAATKSSDLDPTPHFAESDALRGKSLSLTANLIVFAFAFWFLTLAQIIENRAKYLALAVGVLFMLAGIFGMTYLELLL